MNIVRGDDRDPQDRDIADAEVTSALRALFTPPADDSYWETLERRIMQTVAAERAREWWSYFPGWVRIGVSAAAAAALVAAIASWQTRAAEERMALEQIMDVQSEIPLLTEFDRGERGRQREETLRYLIRHD
jgi:anti-sigma-K factor RskA